MVGKALKSSNESRCSELTHRFDLFPSLLGSNRLKVLPPAIGELQNLREFNIGGNQLVSLFPPIYLLSRSKPISDPNSIRLLFRPIFPARF